MTVTDFSIVITTFNRLSLLRKAVESALNQTIDCQVIVIDDCSSDGTPEYAQELGDKIIYHRNPENIGHSASVNLGVEIATGKWIKLLDDDDYLALNCVEEMTKAIESHPQAVICSCQSIQVDQQEQEISRSQKVGLDQTIYIAQEDIHYGMLLEQVPFGTPVQIAFRRDAFLASGGWNSKFDLAYDDIDSWVRISQMGDAIFINQYLAYRRLWTGSYHEEFSFLKRLQTNIEIKKNIYSLVHQKYQTITPSFATVRHYLNLHWGLIALFSQRIPLFFEIANVALVSPRAWSLFIQIMLWKKGVINSNFSQTKYHRLETRVNELV